MVLERLEAFKVAINTSIFFVETNKYLRVFPDRVLCSFESAAKYNPTRKIVVILKEESIMNEGKIDHYFTS